MSTHEAFSESELREFVTSFLYDSSDQDVAREFYRVFSKSPQLLEQFRRAYGEMMQDSRRTFLEKADYFLDCPGMSEEDARDFLEHVWHLATGSPWPKPDSVL